MSQSEPWLDTLILESGEIVAKSWKGSRKGPLRTYVIDGQTRQSQTWPKGILVMTTQRLVWVDQRGLFQKSYHPEVSVGLEDVKGISLGGWLRKYVTIASNETSDDFRLDFVGEREFPEFKQNVMSQSALRKSSISEQKQKERINVTIDFSFLKQYMERGGTILRTVKCTNCGAPMQLPEAGNKIVCPHCGTTHYSEDIFDKVKQLIG